MPNSSFVDSAVVKNATSGRICAKIVSCRRRCSKCDVWQDLVSWRRSPTCRCWRFPLPVFSLMRSFVQKLAYSSCSHCYNIQMHYVTSWHTSEYSSELSRAITYNAYPNLIIISQHEINHTTFHITWCESRTHCVSNRAQAMCAQVVQSISNKFVGTMHSLLQHQINNLTWWDQPQDIIHEQTILSEKMTRSHETS